MATLLALAAGVAVGFASPAAFDAPRVPEEHAPVDPPSEEAAAPLRLRWVPIPPGQFEMGCSRGDDACHAREGPRHTVILTRPFAMTATEVTQGQFRAYATATGRRLPRQPFWSSEDHPVVNVTWEEMRDFCSWAGGRLPTEAEWEYAARAGSTSAYPWGDTFDDNRGNGGGTGAADRWTEAAPVASFPPNAYGLFDMVGNVWEWVHDWYSPDAYAEAPAQDPRGPEAGEERVLRGGSWDSGAGRLRVSFRMMLPPTARYNLYIGGRCARDVPAAQSAGGRHPLED